MISDAPWHELRRSARQVIFRTKVQEAPVSVGGTYFLVGYEGRLFAATAKHVVRNAVPEELLLLPNDKSLVPARILEQFNISDEASGDVDLVIYDLDTRHFNTKDRRASRAYDLSATEPSWLTAYHQEFSYCLFGYPRMHTNVDYGTLTTKTESQQWFLEGEYKGRSSIPNAHTLSLFNARSVEDLDGLSGAPVFAYVQRQGIVHRPVFAGIALTGTVASGLVHFLGADAVRTILDNILLRPRKKLPVRWRGGKTRMRRRPSQHE